MHILYPHNGPRAMTSDKRSMGSSVWQCQQSLLLSLMDWNTALKIRVRFQIPFIWTFNCFINDKLNLKLYLKNLEKNQRCYYQGPETFGNYLQSLLIELSDTVVQNLGQVKLQEFYYSLSCGIIFRVICHGQKWGAHRQISAGGGTESTSGSAGSRKRKWHEIWFGFLEPKSLSLGTPFLQ